MASRPGNTLLETRYTGPLQIPGPVNLPCWRIFTIHPVVRRPKPFVEGTQRRTKPSTQNLKVRDGECEREVWMVRWPWSQGSEGHGEEVVVGMAAGKPSTEDHHIEKDVLAAGRAACYKARDAFFKCVESDAGHTTPTEIASVGLLYPSHCKSARAFYEQSCRSTWVKHFDRQFCAKKRVKRLLDSDRARGPMTLPSESVGLQPGD